MGDTPNSSQTCAPPPGQKSDDPAIRGQKWSTMSRQSLLVQIPDPHDDLMQFTDISIASDILCAYFCLTPFSASALYIKKTIARQAAAPVQISFSITRRVHQRVLFHTTTVARITCSETDRVAVWRSIVSTPY
ncbi:hypothetical protein NDU88_008102 [Pleurodeles waltl]|uniref:Uncharacterized protein n=1 Tax=Pleurodeles waltl TaxID=8319 RepID=A0AAV7RUT9_PLEWA|nr:hypothetical protein NDU88_008102 [Pleurodeles waltl]